MGTPVVLASTSESGLGVAEVVPGLPLAGLLEICTGAL